jgi:hypothetical protein
VTRNQQISETILLRSLESALKSSLPEGWLLVKESTSVRASNRPDLLLGITGPDGEAGQVLVEAKRTLEPRDIPRALEQLTGYMGQLPRNGATVALMVVAPHLSPRARAMLAAANAGWFDMAGNFRLQLDRPALFIDREGASRRPYRSGDERGLRSLRGPGAARVIRTLLDRTGPVRIRELASLAGVGLATSSRVIDLLTRDALIGRDQVGGVEGVRKGSLVRRWVQDYGITRSNEIQAVLAPRGVERVLRDLVSEDMLYAVTGSAAQRVYLPPETTPVAPLSLLTVFTPDAGDAQELLKLRPADRSANLLLVEPFDDVVFRNTVFREDVRYAAPSQTVADLLSGPGRSAEEGEQLIGVLADPDSEWAL